MSLFYGLNKRLNIHWNQNIQVETQKLEWTADSRIGSLENADHKPLGGDVKVCFQHLLMIHFVKTKLLWHNASLNLNDEFHFFYTLLLHIHVYLVHLHILLQYDCSQMHHFGTIFLRL